jgi:hypothetical protein
MCAKWITRLTVVAVALLLARSAEAQQVTRVPVKAGQGNAGGGANLVPGQPKLPALPGLKGEKGKKTGKGPKLISLAELLKVLESLDVDPEVVKEIVKLLEQQGGGKNGLLAAPQGSKKNAKGKMAAVKKAAARK